MKTSLLATLGRLQVCGLVVSITDTRTDRLYRWELSTDLITLELQLYTKGLMLDMQRHVACLLPLPPPLARDGVEGSWGWRRHLDRYHLGQEGPGLCWRQEGRRLHSKPSALGAGI